MNIKERLNILDNTGKDLLAAIENKSWDVALHYSHEWSACIRDLFDCVTSDQFMLYESELLNIENQLQDVTGKLTHLRAKTLTQLQDISKYHAFNKLYSDRE